ncbi:hypothetical protein ACQ4PT_056318 [Festuca glaucescens]
MKALATGGDNDLAGVAEKRNFVAGGISSFDIPTTDIDPAYAMFLAEMQKVVVRGPGCTGDSSFDKFCVFGNRMELNLNQRYTSLPFSRCTDSCLLLTSSTAVSSSLILFTENMIATKSKHQIKNFQITWREAGLKPINFSSFDKVYPNVPKQKEGNNCGIHCMKLIESYCPRNPSLYAYSDKDVPYLRTYREKQRMIPQAEHVE